MSDQVVKIDSNAILSNVKERIKNAYIHMIPDNAWEGLVKTEMDEFFRLRTRDNRYCDNNVSYSPFRNIVFKMLQEKISNLLKDYIKTNLESNNWDNGIQEPTQFVKDIISQNSEKILTDLLAGMLQKSISTNF